MRIFIFIVLIQIGIKSGAQHSNKDTFFVNIPNEVKLGRMIYDIHSDLKDSSFMILFDAITSESKKKKAAFFLTISRQFEKVDSSYFENKKCISPESLMDCLVKKGRSYIRNNVFYSIFKKGDFIFLHRSKGEYVFSDYSGDDVDITESVKTKNKR